MRFQLLQRIESDPDDDEQPRAAEKLGEGLGHLKLARHEKGEDRHRCEGDGARKRDAGHDAIDVHRCAFTRTHPRYEASVPLHVVCELIRIHHDRGVEIAEKHDHSGVDPPVE